MSNNNKPRPEPPTELRAACKIPPGTNLGTRRSYHNCHDLTIYGKHDNYTWGFRIYRTSYSGANANAEFNKAIEILHSYLRKTIFSDFECHVKLCEKENPNTKDILDDASEQQLWKRLQNDIVEDHALLENASPARLNELHHEWLESRGEKTVDNCRNRYFLILDEEVLDNLLFLPPPEEVHRSPTICLKVFDAEFGLPSSYFGSVDTDSEDSDDEDEEGYSSEEDDGYEGWFWTRAESLMEIWFEDSQKERHSEVYTWDEESRPVRAR